MLISPIGDWLNNIIAFFFKFFFYQSEYRIVTSFIYFKKYSFFIANMIIHIRQNMHSIVSLMCNFFPKRYIKEKKLV